MPERGYTPESVLPLSMKSKYKLFHDGFKVSLEWRASTLRDVSTLWHKRLVLLQEAMIQHTICSFSASKLIFQNRQGQRWVSLQWKGAPSPKWNSHQQHRRQEGILGLRGEQEDSRMYKIRKITPPPQKVHMLNVEILFRELPSSLILKIFYIPFIWSVKGHWNPA